MANETAVAEPGFMEALLHPVGVALDPVFSPLTVFPPFATIFIMSVVLTVTIMFVSRLFVNRKLMMQIKEQMEEIKENLNRAQKEKNEEDQKRYLDELMKVNGEYMRHTMKIMLVSIVVVIFLFPWLSLTYHGQTVVQLPFNMPIVNWMSLEWFWWYVISAFAVGTVLRKIMGSDI